MNIAFMLAFIIAIFLGSSSSYIYASPSFPAANVSLPEYWGVENVWWHGRANFKGQVIAPACSLAMEDTYQAINMGVMPIRDLEETSSGPEKKLSIRLRDCEFSGIGKGVYSASRIRVTFDGIQGEMPDRFSLSGQARGISLQITDNNGFSARPGKIMPPLLLNGGEEGLNYKLRIVRNGQPLHSGNYYAALRFKVDYE